MKATASELLRQLPGKVTDEWPMGERFIRGLAHGSMSVEIYAPVAVDPQTPHDQDELYFIHNGHGVMLIGGARYSFAPGDCFFVAAGARHQLVSICAGAFAGRLCWGCV